MYVVFLYLIFYPFISGSVAAAGPLTVPKPDAPGALLADQLERHV
jgi:hypothetical protein